MLSMLLVAPALSFAGEKPNLLFIVTDEQSFRTIGCYRNLLTKDQAEIWGEGNIVETPNLDKLAVRGTLFNRMYASAPVSTPARASMFTGMYGHQLGMHNNSNKPGDGKYLRSNVKTIAQCLVDAGYMTGYSGKLHLAEAREVDEFWQPFPVPGEEGYNYGFIDNKYMFNGGHGKYIGIDNEGNPYFASKRPTKIGKDEYGNAVYKDNRSSNVKSTNDFLGYCTVRFIEENKDKPFYYVVSIPDPHTPDQACDIYHDMYTHMDFKKPATYFKEKTSKTPNWQSPDGKAEKVETLSLPQYFGMVKNIDDNIGRILDKLEKEGILENTIIVFTSDHGDLMGEHARMNKGTIHEASARVPFLIAHGKDCKNPLVPRGKVVTEAANTTDWMPTFLSLLNVDCHKVAGRDLTPLLAKKAPKNWNDVTFSQLGFSAAIDSRYKLRVSPFNEEPWLLDIVEDPDELVNFIDNPKYKDVVVRLAKELKRYNKECNQSNEKIEAVLNRLIK